jgi:hypothetical protein
MLKIVVIWQHRKGKSISEIGEDLELTEEEEKKLIGND